MSGAGRPAGRSVDAAGLSLAIAATRWHAEVTDTLVSRAVAAAARVRRARPAGGPRAGRRRAARSSPPSWPAATTPWPAWGRSIRGGTPHFEYVCDAVTYGLARVALDTGTPVGNGVLTCDDIKQAIDRSGTEDSAEDKGWDAVLAALETALLLRSLRQPPPR